MHDIDAQSDEEVLGETLRDHFLTNGTPVLIMSSDESKVSVILGVEIHMIKDKEGKPSIKADCLVLDPNYSGTDTNLKKALSKGACSWKDSEKIFDEKEGMK